MLEMVSRYSFVCFLILISSSETLSAQNQSQNRALVVAHRGASLEAPENTMAAFKLALEYSPDFIELDVVNTKEESLMVMHNMTLDETTNGTGYIFEYTYDEIRQLKAGFKFPNPAYTDEKIPTLREVLSLAKGKSKVIVDMKISHLYKKIVDLVREMGMTETTIFTHWELFVADSIHQYAPEMNVMQSHDIFSTEDLISLKNAGANYVCYGGLITHDFLKTCDDIGLKVFKWTSSSASESLIYNRFGVYGIFTDSPKEIIGIFNQSPPPQITNFSGQSDKNNILLKWKNPLPNNANVVGYEILYGTSSDNLYQMKITDVNQETIIPGIKEKTTYFFKIRQINSYFLKGNTWSPVISLTTPPDTIPPVLLRSYSFENPDQLFVEFSEPVQFNANLPSSLMDITPHLGIISAKPLGNGRIWKLQTENMDENTDYTINIVSACYDRSEKLNQLRENSTATFRLSVQDPYLISHWAFDEMNENICSNSVNQALHGELKGTYGRTKGIAGQAISFNGKSSCVNIPAIKSLIIDSNQVSISLWMNSAYMPDEYPSTTGPLYKSSDDFYTVYFSRYYNELRFRVTTNTAQGTVGIPAHVIKKNTWHHVAATYDGKQLAIYLDGNIVRTTRLTGNVQNGQTASIGTGPGNAFFKGYIDELRIYNRALKSEEITYQYYNGQIPESNITTGLENPNLTSVFNIRSNYPNPFNPNTAFQFTSGHSGQLKVRLLNMLGQEVQNVYSNLIQSGQHEITINAKNLASGIYLTEFNFNNTIQVKKILLQK